MNTMYTLVFSVFLMIPTISPTVGFSGLDNNRAFPKEPRLSDAFYYLYKKVFRTS